MFPERRGAEELDLQFERALTSGLFGFALDMVILEHECKQIKQPKLLFIFKNGRRLQSQLCRLYFPTYPLQLSVELIV